MTDRKYALTKVRTGDYLLPSNDGKTLWRITRLASPTEGWDLYRWLGKVAPGNYADPDDWAQWDYFEGAWPSREDLIDVALAKETRA